MNFQFLTASTPSRFLWLLIIVCIWPGQLFGQGRSTFRFNSNPQVNADLLQSPRNLSAPLTLTDVPNGLFLEGDDKKSSRIAWQPANVRCLIRYDTRPGNRDLDNHYPNVMRVRGTGSLLFNAFEEDLDAGIYYCILVSEEDASLTSVEFRIIVQANITPGVISPLGNVSLQQGTPLFRWDGVVGVPYYSVFLSEGPVSIDRNDEGKITGLSGLNLTWQVITPETFLKYGDLDPAANFPNVHIPPLIPGIEYNWVVLNSYGPNPDFISSDVAPVAPSFFEVTRPTLQQKPNLLQPINDAALADDEIEFEWTPVAGASRYRFFLFEDANFQDNEIQYVLWSQVTSDTNLRLRARNLLVQTKYSWRIIAESGSLISASERGTFHYDGAAGRVRFDVQSAEGRLSKVTVDILNDVKGSVLLPAITDTFGVASLPLPSGDYRYTASRPGFQRTESSTFTVRTGETTFVPFEMTRGESTIAGRIVDDEGAGLFSATVEAASNSQKEKTFTDANGFFNMALSAGSWDLRAHKRDFTVSESQAVLLQSGAALDVGDIVLSLASNSVTGEIVFASDSRPFQGAIVRAQSDDIIYETTTGSQGGFRFNLGSGNWVITMQAQGFFVNPAQYSFRLSDNVQVPASFQLFEGALVYGIVSFDGLALKGAQLTAVDKTQQEVVQVVQTNSQGSFTMGLAAGDYDLKVSHPDFLTTQRELSVESGQTYVEDFSLSEAGVVQGRVLNLETALPAQGARVFVVEDTTIRTFSDANGRYSLSLPPDMPFQIDASLAGFASTGPLTVVTTAGQILSGQDFFLQALSGVVRGRVTDGFAALPEAKVVIVSLDIETVTDADGRFEFEIPPGAYTIEFGKECHFLRTEKIELVAGTTIDLNIDLQQLSSTILGEVTDSAGAPVPGARIQAIGDTTFSALSNNSGNYELCLGNGIFRVTASKLGYFEADTILVVNENDLHTGVNFRLQESFARLNGVVRDTSRSPIASASVTLRNEAQNLTVVTDAQGRFDFQRVVPGESMLQAQLPGFYGKKESLFLSELEHREVTLTLFPSDGFIRGRVLDSRDSSAIADVQISAEFDLDSEMFFSTQSDQSGNYELRDLPVVAGSDFQVFAFKEGFFSPAPASNVPPKSQGVDFYLVGKSGIISGIVRDFDTAEPIGVARIEAINQTGGRSIAFSDTAGRFTLTNLVPADIYSLSAVKAGYFSGGATNIAAGDTSVAVRLLRKYGFVRGVVTDLQSGLALANIPVRATPLGLDGRLVETMTRTDGSFLLRVAPDFYKIEPALSHFRSEPGFEQHEIAELDTVSNVNFAVEEQTVQTILIQRADQTERPTISNSRTHCYVASARDPSNRPVNIGEPIWRINVSSAAGQIDENGCVNLNSTYFGDLSIQAQDMVSQVSGRLNVQVFAVVDSATETTLFDDRGLFMTIPRNSVVSRKELLVSQEILAPAKRSRARLFTTDHSVVIKPAGLSFNNSPRLLLPPPGNTQGQEHFIAKWDQESSEWDLFDNTVDRGDLLEADIRETGEYVALAISRALAIDNLTLQPNPFSPFLEAAGSSGLQINFDLTSSAAPTPLLTIKIYNLEGNLVRLLHDQTPFPRGNMTVAWDGKTDNGSWARNGRYLVRVIAEDPSDKRDEMKSVVLIK